MPELNLNYLNPSGQLGPDYAPQLNPMQTREWVQKQYAAREAEQQNNMLAQLYAKHYDPQTGDVNYNSLIGEAAQNPLTARAIPDIMGDAQKQSQSMADIAQKRAAAAKYQDEVRREKIKDMATESYGRFRGVKDAESLLAWHLANPELEGTNKAERTAKLQQDLKDKGYDAVRAEIEGSLQAITGIKPEDTGPKLGTYQPGDYTTTSWANFVKTKDPGVLQLKPTAALAPVDPGAVSFYADMIEAGNPLPMGAGTAIRSAVATELSRRGVSAKDVVSAIGEVTGLKAGERTLGSTSANQLAASEEAIPMIGIARDYVSKIDTGKFKSLNAISNWADTHTGDTNIVSLNTALNSLVNSYARAISPKGVPTVSDKNHAREIFDAALSKGQLNAALDVMEKEMNAARTGTTSAKEQIRGGSATTPPAATTPKTAPKVGEIIKGHKFKGGNPSDPKNWEEVK